MTTKIGSNGNVSPEQAPEGETASQPSIVQESMAGMVAGERIEVSDALVGILAAGEVEANDTLIVFGTVGSLSGDAQVLIDTRAAIALGAALGLAFALVSRLLRRGKD